MGVGRERGSFRIAWRLWGGGEDEGSKAKCRRAQVGDCWFSAQKTCTIKEKKKKTNFAHLLAFLLATLGAALPAHFALVLFFSALFLPVPLPPLHPCRNALSGIKKRSRETPLARSVHDPFHKRKDARSLPLPRGEARIGPPSLSLSSFSLNLVCPPFRHVSVERERWRWRRRRRERV